MPKILTDVDTFSADVTVPEDGDARNAASIEPAFQKLSNRTRYLKNIADVAAVTDEPNTFSSDQTAPNWLHATPKTQTRMKGRFSHGISPDGKWAWDTAEGAWTSNDSLGSLMIPIGPDILVPGATLTEFSVRWKPGVSRTGTDRLQFILYEVDLTGAATPVIPETYSTASTTGEHTTEVTGLSHVILSNRSYELNIIAGNDVSHVGDEWNGMSAVCTYAKAGLQT